MAWNLKSSMLKSSLLSLEPKDYLTFRNTKESPRAVALLNITNTSKKDRVAFKIISTAMKGSVTVLPNKGFLEPQETTQVRFTLTYSPRPIFMSKVKVQSVLLPKSNFDLDSVWTAFNGQTASSLLECRYILTPSSEPDGGEKETKRGLGPRSNTWEERPLWKRTSQTKKTWPLSTVATAASAWECQFHGEQEVALEPHVDVETEPSWVRRRAGSETRVETEPSWVRRSRAGSEARGGNVDDNDAWEYKDGVFVAPAESNKESKKEEDESPRIVFCIFFLLLFIVSGIFNRV